MRGRLLAVLLAAPLMILLGLLGVGSPRAAASCAYAADDPELTRSADVIFTGEIVRNQTAKLGREREYTFRVAKVFKGAAYSEQLVATDNRSSEALDIEGPGTFLVLANFSSAETEGPDRPADQQRLQRNPAGHRRTPPVPSMLGPGQQPGPRLVPQRDVAVHRQAVDRGRAGVHRGRDHDQPPVGSPPAPRTAVASYQPGRNAEPVCSRAPSVTGSRPRRTALTSSPWSASV